MIIVAIGFAAWIVITNFITEPIDSPANACINNLRQIDVAKQQWALENGKTNGVICTTNDLRSYIKFDAKGNFLKCPSGGIYTIGKVGEPVTCSLGKTNLAHLLP